MTREAQEKFFRDLSDDEQMQQELQQRYGTDDGVPSEDVERFAAEKGYEFSFEEESGELSEAELEGATGGLSYLDTGRYSIKITSRDQGGFNLILPNTKDPRTNFDHKVY
jgi:hypothetical protein